LVGLLADYEPAPVPFHRMFQPSRLASPKIRAFADNLAERSRGIDSLGAD
jgi:DNA-binding transcriptional LysR family regulator